jgi:hypothetical protein
MCSKTGTLEKECSFCLQSRGETPVEQDQQDSAICPGCNEPLDPLTVHTGHRPRRFHNAACKQRYYRQLRRFTFYKLEIAMARYEAQMWRVEITNRDLQIASLNLMLYYKDEQIAELEGEIARLNTLLEEQAKRRKR